MPGINQVPTRPTPWTDGARRAYRPIVFYMLRQILTKVAQIMTGLVLIDDVNICPQSVIIFMLYHEILLAPFYSLTKHSDAANQYILYIP